MACWNTSRFLHRLWLFSPLTADADTVYPFLFSYGDNMALTMTTDSYGIDGQPHSQANATADTHAWTVISPWWQTRRSHSRFLEQELPGLFRQKKKKQNQDMEAMILCLASDDCTEWINFIILDLRLIFFQDTNWTEVCLLTWFLKRMNA